MNYCLAGVLMAALAACGGDEASPRATNSADSAPAYTGANRSVNDSSSADTGAADVGAAEPAAVEDFDLVGTYQKSCIACHLSGAAGAPKTHDEAAWAPRMAKGEVEILKSMNNGLNSMPPKGMCFDCTDEQFIALSEFMAGPKP